MSCNSTPYVQGWTERIIYQLAHDGNQTFDISGMTVDLVGQDSQGNALAFTGTVGIQTAATSVVYFDPAPTDLLAATSPYRLRWTVTDTGGKVASFPNSATPMVWNIVNP